MIADLKISNKNLLDWGEMEDWESGVPTGMTLTGAAATIEANGEYKHGTYSAAMTRAGTDCYLTYSFPDFADYKGRRMTFGAWIKASVASTTQISIGDGVGTTDSSYHAGDSAWSFMSVTRNIDASATGLYIWVYINNTNTTSLIDGMILCEGSSAFLDISTYAEKWDLSRKYNNSKFTIPRRDGVYIPEIHYGEKTLSIKGKVWGTTATTARTAWDTFLQAMNDGEKDIFLHDDRFVRGYLVSESHNYIAALRVVEFTLQFVIPKPFTYYFQRTRLSQVITATTAFSLTTTGSVYTKPKINFIAGVSDITSLQFQNLTTGEVFTFSGTVTAGQTLIVDCEECTVENNGTDAIAYFTGDFAKLNPGVNALLFTGSNCTIKIDYYNRWL